MLTHVSAQDLHWLGVGTAAEQNRLLAIVRHARRRGVNIHLASEANTTTATTSSSTAIATTTTASTLPAL
jgi:hypothetical protein